MAYVSYSTIDKNYAAIRIGAERFAVEFKPHALSVMPRYHYTLNLDDRSVTVWANTPREIYEAMCQIRQQADEGLKVFSLIGYDRFAKFDDGEIMIWFTPHENAKAREVVKLM